jgi:hypothetical protein
MRLKNENDFLLEENKKMKMLFLKTLTEIQTFENKEVDRYKEITVSYN